MKLQINGKSHEVEPLCSLVALIKQLDLDPRYLVVEHNGQALGRDGFAAVTLAEGDRLELVRPVAGG